MIKSTFDSVYKDVPINYTAGPMILNLSPLKNVLVSKKVS